MKIFGHCLLILLSSTITCFAQNSYYIEDTKGALQLIRGDPSKISPKEWQYKLYKRGEQTCTNKNWGLISEKTLEKANKALKRGQEVEKDFAKWAGQEYPELHTHTNICGPIAKFEELKKYQGSVDALDSIWKIITVFKEDFDLYKKISQQKDIIKYKPGDLLKEYAKNLKSSTLQLEKLRAALEKQVDRKEVLKMISECSDGLTILNKSHTAMKEFIAKTNSTKQRDNSNGDIFYEKKFFSGGNIISNKIYLENMILFQEQAYWKGNMILYTYKRKIDLGKINNIAKSGSLGYYKYWIYKNSDNTVYIEFDGEGVESAYQLVYYNGERFSYSHERVSLLFETEADVSNFYKKIEKRFPNIRFFYEYK